MKFVASLLPVIEIQFYLFYLQQTKELYARCIVSLFWFLITSYGTTL